MLHVVEITNPETGRTCELRFLSPNSKPTDEAAKLVEHFYQGHIWKLIEETL